MLVKPRVSCTDSSNATELRVVGPFGARALHTLELQCTDEVSKALVSNRLTSEQGTSRNEAVHKKFWQDIRRFGGNRSFELLQLLIDVIVFKHNGALLQTHFFVQVPVDRNDATCISRGGLVQTCGNEATSPCHEVAKHVGHLLSSHLQVDANPYAVLDFFLFKDRTMVQKQDLLNYVARDA
jgi:hypothetical protein